MPYGPKYMVVLQQFIFFYCWI